jgi:flagellar hook protein FlgE
MAFQQGLSGLNATSKALEIIGNNIANANTFGAKASRAEFSDMYAAALNGAGANSIGIGVRLAAVAQQFTQGNISVTENAMDLAINGAGFFQLTDGHNPPLFSRNGQFKVDREGFLVNNQGLQLMGYPADGTGTIRPGAAVALQLPTAGVPPQATSDIRIEFNLDSRAGPVPTAPAVNFSDPTTYNNATSMTVFDALGQDIALTYYFQRAPLVTGDPPGVNRWNVFVTANGTPLNSPVGGPVQPVTQMVFPPDGTAPTSPAGPVAMPIPATTHRSGALTTPVTVALDLGRATQFGTAFGVTNMTQNGYAPGQLAGITIEPSGIIMARYSNGQSQPAGQIELATFRNPQGLQPMGSNAWTRTFASGDPIVGVPGEGNMGVLQAGALEESNVDLTAELVKMIGAQRMYQANAQTIKTMDQALQSIVNLR